LTWQWFNNNVDKTKWQTAVWWSFYEKESGFESFLAETLKHLGVEVKASEALMLTERSGYVLQGADVNLFLAQFALGQEKEKDKVKAKEYAESALKLAYCDGPPYYYKVAYDEAVAILEKLK
jgi:hypothetical protein